jgi:hypothetical protein
MWLEHSQQVQSFLIDTSSRRASRPTRSPVQLIHWSTFSRELSGLIVKLTTDLYNAEVKNVDL